MAVSLPYPITAVQDRLGLDLDGLKALLGITGDAENAVLQLWLDAALSAADEYLGNPFWQMERDEVTGRLVYVEPVVELPIPASVKLGVVELVKGQRELPGGVLEQKTAKLTVKYASREELLAAVQEQWWAPFRLIRIG